MPRARRWPSIVSMVAATLLLATAGACTTGGPSAGGPTTSAGDAASAPLYLSLGDSYAAGFQPEGSPTDQGFAEQLTATLSGTAQAVSLVNLGCPGQTSLGATKDPGCTTQSSVPTTVAHPSTTQLVAAEQALAAHRSPGPGVRLVTIVIGGNDLTSCWTSSTPVACARARMPALRAHLSTILTGLKAQAPGARVVGLTYPDVYLALLLTGSAKDAAAATASVTVFRDVLNPTLKKAYTEAGASFIDITALSGAYDASGRTTELEGRVVPTAVATICQNTHFCEVGDVHPTTSGYAFYAEQVRASLTGSGG